MKKVKDYPLEVEYLTYIDDGGIALYYSKGHHDPVEFAAEALKEQDVIIDPQKVMQKYMRWEMCPSGNGPCHSGNISNCPGRGKFPVTYAEIWDEIEEDGDK